MEWGLLVAKVKSAISGARLQQLRDVYAAEKDLMENFLPMDLIQKEKTNRE